MLCAPNIRQPSMCEQVGESVDFSLCIARRHVVVRGRPSEVDGGMGHIQVPAHHHGTVLAELAHEGRKRPVPLLPKGQALQAF